MSENHEEAFVAEHKIEEFLQFFLDDTQLGRECGGVLHLPPDMMSRHVERFKKTFSKQWNGEYHVLDKDLYTFIQEIMMDLVQMVADEEVKAGRLELGWSSECNDFVYLKVDKNGKESKKDDMGSSTGTSKDSSGGDQ